MDVKKNAKNAIKSTFIRHGYHLDATATQSQIRSFLQSVRPVKTDYDLIRVGGTGDGGYLIPDDLDGVNGCFSPGVSTIANFEQELADRGMKCYLADFSVDTPPVEHENFIFDKMFIGMVEDESHFSLENWVARYSPENKGDYILQMDIEGDEYGVIFDTSHDTFNKFRVLVIEFHHLDAMISRLGFEVVNFAFQKLLKNFYIVHIHPNNLLRPVRCGDFEIPPLMEFTFLRKDRVHSVAAASEFPHPLDVKNLEYRDDFPLPKCWYE